MIHAALLVVTLVAACPPGEGVLPDHVIASRLVCPPAPESPILLPPDLELEIVVPGLHVYAPRLPDFTLDEATQRAMQDALMEQYIEIIVDPADVERAVNEGAFESVYLPLKERLFARNAGRWIVIVAGEVLPAGEDGRLIPAEDLDTALAAAHARHPHASHRFVFRIGEEGDVSYDPTLSPKENIIGRQFLQHLRPHCFVAAGSGVWISISGEPGDPDMFRIGRNSADEGAFLSPVVRMLDGEGERPIEFHVATGYSGFSIVSRAYAMTLGLARWEIPGRVHAMGLEFRRARAHFRLDEAGLDETLPVAVRTN